MKYIHSHHSFNLISDVERSRVERMIVSLKPFLLMNSPRNGRSIFDITISIADKCGSQPFSVIFTNQVNVTVSFRLTY